MTDDEDEVISEYVRMEEVAFPLGQPRFVRTQKRFVNSSLVLDDEGGIVICDECHRNACGYIATKQQSSAWCSRHSPKEPAWMTT